MDGDMTSRGINIGQYLSYHSNGMDGDMTPPDDYPYPIESYHSNGMDGDMTELLRIFLGVDIISQQRNGWRYDICFLVHFQFSIISQQRNGWRYDTV